MADKTVSVLLRFIAEKAGIQQAIAGNQKVARSLEDIRKVAERTKQAYETLGQVSARTAAAGAGLLAPLYLSAQKYVEVAGKAETVSRRWLQATEERAKAQQELGRKAAEALLPYQQLLTDIIQKASQLDPRILQAGAAIGTGLALVGAAGLIAAQIGRFATEVRLLGAYLQRNALAQKTLVGGAAVTAGAFIGIQAVRGIGRATDNERLQNYGFDDVAQTLKEALGLLAALFIKAGQELAEGFAYIKYQFDLAKIKVKEGIDGVSDALANAKDTLLKAVLGIEKALADAELLGVNIGEKFGLDKEAIQRRIDEIDQRITDRGGPQPITVNDLRSILEGAGLSAAQQFDTELATRNAGGFTVENLVAELQKLPLTPQVLKALSDLRDLEQSRVDEFEVMREDARLNYERTVNNIATNTENLTNSMLKFLGFIEEANDAAEKTTGFTFSEDALNAFDKYLQETQSLQEEFNRSRTQAERDFQAESLAITEDYNRQRAQAVEDFERGLLQQREDFDRQQARQESDHYRRLKELQVNYADDTREAEKDYQQGRAKAIEDFGKEEIKRLNDFNLKRERAEQDHRQRLQEAAGRLDAIAVLNELRNFNKEKQRGGQDFDLESQQRKQAQAERLKQEADNFKESQAERAAQFAEQQRQEKENFARQQDQARQDFALREARQREDFERQRTREAEQFARSQADREEAYLKERNRELEQFQRLQADREAAFKREIGQLEGWQTKELKARQEHYKQLNKQLNDFFVGSAAKRAAKAASSAANAIKNALPGFASGGYLPDGAARTHAGEYALNRSTTRLLEKATGGRLTQQSVQNLTNSRNFSVSGNTFSFGDVGSYSPAAIEGMVEKGIRRAFEGLAS